MPIRPIVAMIAVTASATGSSAATSAPKAMSRMPKATGTAEYSAFLKSSPNASSNVFIMLAPPISSIRSDPWSFWTPSTAFSTGSTRSPAVSASPRMSNCTSALRPSFEIVFVSYGEVTSVTRPVPSTARTTAVTASLNSASVAFRSPLLAWIRTVSPAGSSIPASSMILAAVCVSPFSWSLSLTSARPAAEPSPIARTTNSTQMPTAAHRCRALQPPARAARPRTRASPFPMTGLPPRDAVAAPCRPLSSRRYGPDKAISSCCPVTCRGRNSSPWTSLSPHRGGPRMTVAPYTYRAPRLCGS